MTANAPTPTALAGHHGTGLRASAEAVHAMKPATVALSCRVAGSVTAWTLVDARDGNPRVVTTATTRTRLCDPWPAQRRAAGVELAQVLEPLVTLAETRPGGTTLAIAYHGPSSVVLPLAEAVRELDSMSFIRPDLGADVRAAVQVAIDTTKGTLRSVGALDLEVATDASVQRMRRGAGAGWVNSWGGYGYGPVDSANILVAELAAIAMALENLPKQATRVTVRSDSQAAINLAGQVAQVGQQAMTGHVPSKAKHAAGVIEDVARTVPLRFVWVRGHSGDPLNETADRLAVLSRRTSDAHLPEEQVAGMAREIVRDLWDASPAEAAAA